MFKVKKTILGFLKGVSPVFNDGRLFQSKKAPVFLPFYHLVADKAPAHIKHLYKPRSVAAFEKEVDYILQHFQPIDAQELIRRTKEESWTDSGEKNMVHFTFDDGLKEVKDIVSGILKRKGVPATFFINPSFLDDQDIFYRYRVSMLWEEIDENRVDMSQISTLRELLKSKGLYREDLKTSLFALDYTHKDLIRNICKTMLYERKSEKIYLGTEDVKQLIKLGFSIGAHSMDHPLYARVDPEEQKRQTKESLDQLVKDFNLNYHLFSFPFTDHGVSTEFFDWLHHAKKPIADLSFGTAGLKSGIVPHHLQRVPMEHFPESGIKKNLKSEYLYYFLLRTVNKH